jgi:hypothetical protein
VICVSSQLRREDKDPSPGRGRTPPAGLRAGFWIVTGLLASGRHRGYAAARVWAANVVVETPAALLIPVRIGSLRMARRTLSPLVEGGGKR